VEIHLIRQGSPSSPFDLTKRSNRRTTPDYAYFHFRVAIHQVALPWSSTFPMTFDFRVPCWYGGAFGNRSCRVRISCCQWRSSNSSCTSIPSRVRNATKESSKTCIDSKSAVRAKVVITEIASLPTDSARG